MDFGHDSEEEELKVFLEKSRQINDGRNSSVLQNSTPTPLNRKHRRKDGKLPSEIIDVKDKRLTAAIDQAKRLMNVEMSSNCQSILSSRR